MHEVRAQCLFQARLDALDMPNDTSGVDTVILSERVCAPRSYARQEVHEPWGGHERIPFVRTELAVLVLAAVAPRLLACGLHCCIQEHWRALITHTRSLQVGLLTG